MFTYIMLRDHMALKPLWYTPSGRAAGAVMTAEDPGTKQVHERVSAMIVVH